jgi:hypothetical protein
MQLNRYKNPSKVIGVVGSKNSTTSRGKAASVPNASRRICISERMVMFFSIKDRAILKGPPNAPAFSGWAVFKFINLRLSDI